MIFSVTKEFQLNFPIGRTCFKGRNKKPNEVPIWVQNCVAFCHNWNHNLSRRKIKNLKQDIVLIFFIVLVVGFKNGIQIELLKVNESFWLGFHYFPFFGRKLMLWLIILLWMRMRITLQTWFEVTLVFARTCIAFVLALAGTDALALALALVVHRAPALAHVFALTR